MENWPWQTGSLMVLSRALAMMANMLILILMKITTKRAVNICQAWAKIWSLLAAKERVLLGPRM
jgi:hypothetical protein